jgi:hypothetical protein
VIVDVHAHVIVAEVTRGWRPGVAGSVGLPEGWRPLVRRDRGGQVVEFRGRSIRSAVGEFVDVDRMLEEAAACGVDRLVLSPWVNLLPYDLDPPAASRTTPWPSAAPPTPTASAPWGRCRCRTPGRPPPSWSA